MILLNSSLPAFLAASGSEETCLQHVFATKWPRGFICPYCDHNDGYRLSNRRSIQCASCRRQTSITANTLFQDSHLPLSTWFLAIYLIAHDKGGISALRLAKGLGINANSAFLLLSKVRAAMGERDKNLTLAGYIELDEAYFGGRSQNKKAGKSPFDGKIQVLVMVESEFMAAGNVVMSILPDNEIDTLKDAISPKVESDPPGQYFRSDARGFHHVVQTLGHHLNMSVMSHVELNTKMACVSLVISHAKRFFKGTYHHFCKLHIQSYLDEFCYRWNRRHLEKQLASNLITACVLHPAAPAWTPKISSLALLAA